MAADRTQAWAGLVRDLFPPGIAVRCVLVPDAQSDLFPDEADAITRARTPRRREFIAGRTAARQAMAELGVAAQAIAMAGDRAPIWPDGLVGSLSHTRDKCVAVLAPVETAPALGVDIEDDDPLARDLWHSVLRPAEISWLDTLAGADSGLTAKRIFSAKECAYKCQYPLTRTLLDFQDIQITLTPDRRGFAAEFQKDVGPFHAGTRLVGASAQGHGIVASGMILKPGPLHV